MILLALALLACHPSACPPAQTWNGTFDEPVARPEHPRPDLRRDDWINLNTTWDFAEDPDDIGLEQGWQGGDLPDPQAIQLPYAWEAPLAGLVEPYDGEWSVAHTMAAETYRGVGWYHLRLPAPLPDLGDGSWHLVVGAADYDATAWADGEQIASHQGGYSPFSGPLPEGARDLVLRVEDLTELNDRTQPVGKQGGTWYTRTSGVWQTVYLEWRPTRYLASFRVVTDETGVTLTPVLSDDQAASVQLTATLDGEPAGSAQATVHSGEPITLALDTVRRWSPEDPALYDLDITVDGEDTVHSTFGLARWGTTSLPDTAAGAFTLNDEPVYLRCVLDQSYWPDGIYTAPSLEDIQADLDLVREQGFNCVRLHLKPDEPVKLHLLDQAGFIVLYDIPSLDMMAPNTPDFAGRDNFARTMTQVMERDANHPAIALWTVFNENWGLMADPSLVDPPTLAEDADMQGWVRDMVALARQTDPTRPVEDNSAGGIVGVFEHVGGDSNSFHWYDDDPAVWREFLDTEAAQVYPGSAASYVGGAVQDGAPWWCSEFAGFSTVGGAGEREQYCELFPIINELRRQPKLTGLVLTQLTDVEYELNGLVLYDRQPRDLCDEAGVGLADLLGQDFVGFESVDENTASLFVSTWGQPQDVVVSLSWDDAPAFTQAQTSTAAYQTVPIDFSSLPLPDEAGEHWLVATLLDTEGQRMAANRIAVDTSR